MKEKRRGEMNGWRDEQLKLVQLIINYRFGEIEMKGIIKSSG
jgi:hypothetical protein